MRICLATFFVLFFTLTSSATQSPYQAFVLSGHPYAQEHPNIIKAKKKMADHKVFSNPITLSKGQSKYDHSHLFLKPGFEALYHQVQSDPQTRTGGLVLANVMITKKDHHFFDQLKVGANKEQVQKALGKPTQILSQEDMVTFVFRAGPKAQPVLHIDFEGDFSTAFRWVFR